jgi:hypothetical protein
VECIGSTDRRDEPLIRSLIKLITLIEYIRQIKLKFIVIIFLPGVLFSQGKIIYSKLSDTIPQSIISHGYLDSVFTFCTQRDDVIDYDDCNICKSRAHILARAIEKNFPDAFTSKVWLFADCKRSSKAAEYKYKPQVYLEFEGKCSSWSYHVAPIVISAGDTFVIDPATQSSIVKLSNWAMQIIPAGGKGLMVVKNKEYFIYPEDGSNFFDDEKSNWMDSEKITTDPAFARSIDEMTIARLGLIEPWQMKYHAEKLKEMVE